MKAPPRLSTVKAPATCNGSPVATYGDLGIRDVGGEGDGGGGDGVRSRPAPGADRMTLWPECSTPVRPRICVPPRDALGGARLAEHLPVDLEHRVAADRAVEVGVHVGRPRRRRPCGVRAAARARRARAVPRLRLRRGDRLLVDVGRRQRLDAAWRRA
jgi:hypothetical protein